MWAPRLLKIRGSEKLAPLRIAHLWEPRALEPRIFLKKKMRGDSVRGVLMRGVFRCGENSVV